MILYDINLKTTAETTFFSEYQINHALLFGFIRILAYIYSIVSTQNG